MKKAQSDILWELIPHENEFVITEKDLLDYITNLQERIDQYENPDDLTLFYMWLDEKAKDKMKQLQEENERLKKELNHSSMNEYSHSIDESWYRELYEDYKSRIDKAIEYIEEHKTEITKTQANIFNEDRQDKPKLKVGTFMWGVDNLLNILRGDKE